jgi:acyl carrier protein
MARPGGHRDSAYLLEMVEKEQITTLHFVPSMLQVFLEEKNLAARCGSLKRVICSGEALPYDLQERFFAQLDVELYNLYGPTEAAVEVTSWKCEPHDRRRVVPIGRPVANTQMRILDEHLQPVPVGVTGGLYIGGVQLARGYLGRADLTAERFIPDPFSERPGSRLYQTGDLARYWPDGEIEYVGRIDHQVKLRGFRIELGEIEATLAGHPAVREQVVVVREDKRGDKILVAYLTVHNGHQPTNNELRSFLAEKLPEYMLPSSFLFLDAVPLTPNGKVDHRRLPAPQPTGSEFEADYIGPRNPVEEVVCDIWIDALGLERVSVHSNFFHLGGHSLLATRITSQLRELFQVDIPLSSFFEASSVAKLAQTIIAKETNKGQTEKIARAFKSIRGMSEIEIANMLEQNRHNN